MEIEEMEQSCRSLMVHHTQQLDLDESENDYHPFDLENPEVQPPHIEDASQILYQSNQKIIKSIIRELEGEFYEDEEDKKDAIEMLNFRPKKVSEL